MGKTVFRPSEINSKQGEKVTLKLIHDYSPQKDDESEKIEEYTGPTPEELRREAEAFKAGWEIEKQHQHRQQGEKAAIKPQWKHPPYPWFRRHWAQPGLLPAGRTGLPASGRTRAPCR